MGRHLHLNVMLCGKQIGNIRTHSAHNGLILEMPFDCDACRQCTLISLVTLSYNLI